MNYEPHTEEILIERLEKGQINNRADLQEVERIARDRGLTRLAKRASRQRNKLKRARKSSASQRLRRWRSRH
jgi:hypothetical protein